MNNPHLNDTKVKYVIIMVIYTIVGFVTLRYSTEILDYDELSKYGIYNAILYFLYPMTYIGSLGLLRVVYFKGEYIKNKRNLYNVSDTVISVFSLITLVSILTFDFEIDSIFLVLLTCWIRLRKDTLVMELLSERNIKDWGRVVISFSFFQFFLVLSVLNYSTTWEARVLCYLLSDVLCLAMYYRWGFFTEIIPFKGTSYFDISVLKRILFFGIPCVIAVFPAWLNEEADKLIILNYFEDGYFLAAYVASYGLGMTFNQVINAYISFYSKDFFESLKVKNRISSLKSKLIKHNVIINILAMMFSASIYAFPIVFIPEKYHDFLTITIIIIYSCAILAGSRLVAIFIEYNEQTKIKLKISCIGAICNIFFSILFINKLGVYAPAIGTLISSIVSLIITILLSAKYDNKISRGIND
ncbi:hypothetical protein [Vibrio sp. VB16]|uniref:hypothetical protein n=1 Tax=Vibrio sp. VB16 TaxID=2785746 RepID=UPI0018A0F7AE|nr:hypothetical protein [Vibrio sp. VB16]UGA57357.1 hypothetical protein IUZ65_017820 [Vibrio sp. VB16]